jgi:hypothetical protein
MRVVERRGVQPHPVHRTEIPYLDISPVMRLHLYHADDVDADARYPAPHAGTGQHVQPLLLRPGETRPVMWSSDPADGRADQVQLAPVDSVRVISPVGTLPGRSWSAEVISR